MNSPASDKNRRTALMVATIVAAMTGLAFVSPPLYRAFCQATGWGGVPQRADAAPGAQGGRLVTVRFDATVNQDLPWSFEPEQVAQTLKIGESGIAFYRATNHSDRPVTGRATFNVAPSKAGVFFKKIDCFCFTEQTLQPGETVSMPVTYFIDPEIARNRGLDDVSTVTLAYTFFLVDEPAPKPQG